MTFPISKSNFSEQRLGGLLDFAVGSLACCLTAFIVLTIHRYAQPERVYPTPDPPTELQTGSGGTLAHCSYEAGKAGWYGPAC